MISILAFLSLGQRIRFIATSQLCRLHCKSRREICVICCDSHLRRFQNEISCFEYGIKQLPTFIQFKLNRQTSIR